MTSLQECEIATTTSKQRQSQHFSDVRINLDLGVTKDENKHDLCVPFL